MQNWKKKIGAGLGLAGIALMAGCGASQDFGGFSRSTGGDISPGYGSTLSSRADAKRNGVFLQGTYAKIEASFKLAGLTGDPFDYEKTQVMVSLHRPDGSALDVPAFYDGADTWRMRFTPSQPGTYAVASIKLNGEITHETALEPKQWEVKGDPQPGFVRVDRGDHSRFVFDSGARYYPLGHNQAWRSDKLPDIPELFGKMHTAGENWSRVWMNHWDGKNLDWSADKKTQTKLGEIDLTAAKRWDSIIDAAGKNDIYFQLTLQHHGQYSADVNPNWNDNPYNVKNGGFLTNPEDFFTDAKARALTKRKLYYIIARYGYSPNILSWELFNEVQFTDAGRNKQWNKIALWHREMALFIKQWDGYHHLVTTSSADAIAWDSPIWQTVDYAQVHAYPSDILTGLHGATAAQAKKLDKPVFIGEFGGGNLKDTDGRNLHIGLWNSLMQNVSGAAQYWSWDEVENNNLYSQFQSASKFLTASGMANQGGTTALSLPVETNERAALRFAPGGGFGSATQSEFVVGASGVPAGMAQYPTFLQGDAHRAMTPAPLTLQVNFLKAGTFTVEIAQAAKSGAKLVVGVDGKTTTKDYPAADKDYTPSGDAQTTEVPVSIGAHTLTIQNTGKDWLMIRQFALSDYAPALAANARMNGDFAAAWVYSRDGVNAPADKTPSPVTGRLTLTGLKPGKYSATWWDTATGQAGNAEDVTVGKDKTGLTLNTPPITRDAALYIVRSGTSPERIGKIRPAKAKKSDKPAAPPASTSSALTFPPSQ